MDDEFRLPNKWILWYHNPLDTKWTLSSYKVLYNINSIQDFWKIFSFLDNNIVENSMLFLMKDNVEPLWEHENNINGGCWSFKISKGNLKSSWEELSVKLTSETLCKESKIINGISISPKKTFCIIKIWNNNKNKNKSALLNKVNNLSFDSCIYKAHNV